MERRSNYDASFPVGLDGLVLQILLARQGRARAIKLPDLAVAVGAAGRQVREAVKSLRRDGYLIGSSAAADGGYYMCADMGEFEEFVAGEFVAKISDMQETLTRMRHAATAKFGGQMRLI